MPLSPCFVRRLNSSVSLADGNAPVVWCHVSHARDMIITAYLKAGKIRGTDVLPVHANSMPFACRHLALVRAGTQTP
eukprot:1631587-Pleurochrysis_carterae.AAC.5